MGATIMNKQILAAATLIGTIIGAGVFAIPYVVAKSGVLIAVFYFVLLGTVVLLLHLFYSEVILRTNGRHQLTGYVKKYFGPRAKAAALLATILGTVGSLLIYIILAGNFLNVVAPGLSAEQGSLLFWFLMSAFVFLGGKSIAKLELVMSIGMLGIFLLIFTFCWPQVHLINFTPFNFDYFFLPFGVLLFSLVGWNAIPEIVDILDKKKYLLKVVAWSFILCLIIYLLFGFLVAGVVGPNISDNVFEALAPYLGKQIIWLGGILGLLAIATSFVISANYLKHVFRYDCGLPKKVAFWVVSLTPLILFYLGFNQFMIVIGVVGTFMGLAEGSIIALLFWKARQSGDRIPEYHLEVPLSIIIFIIFVLSLGTIVEVLNNLRL